MNTGREARGLRQIGASLGGVLDPVAARRGFGTARLLSAWGEVAGPRYAAFTRPEKLAFPRNSGNAGVLTIGVDGPRAVLLQHEIPQILQRVNAFLGFAAVAEIRLVQRAMTPPPAVSAPPRALSDRERERLDAALAEVDSEGLRGALRELGEAVLAGRPRPAGAR